ncbi:serine/threonine protein kinase [Planotetraspora sp. A-T 1434]|uniref:serine/threonine-protein kinase n=1 Tax=Planotetraspora sp. A-T 1434 TaxID=2979219 RepID=UPI0021BF89E4|nr:serine/threonine-protein kinase [Planotetraspora sp. A-T 1434]MCT9935155.1 serine/threonine protein kinase [Planotetraspora sp. A-T 1434]
MGTAGQLIVKRYRLVRALGQGSMGIVWEARDTLLDRPVAVRQVLLPSDLRESRRTELAQRVAREARQAERLRHPNIAAVYDVAEEDGAPYIVMELVRSRSLDGIVASDGPLTPEKAAPIVRKILTALTYAHASGVRHGDVRPSNVLIGHDGRVLLADFGTGALAADPAFARAAAERSPAHGDPASVARGVSAFLAPERAGGSNTGGSSAGGGAPTVASDLWSLGAVLHLAVTGRRPTGTLDSVPDALRTVVQGLLTRDPKKRLTPETADRLLAAIEPVAAPQPPPAGGSRTRLIAGIATAALLAGAVGGWAVLRPATHPTPIPLSYADVPVASPSGPAPSPSPVQVTRLKLKWHKADVGWRAGVPKDWTLDQTDYSTWWLDPEGRAQLNVEVTGQSGTDPLGALHEAEAILYPSVKAYRKLRLKTVTSKYGTAADWEFTWTQRKASAETHLAKGVAYHQFRRVISTGTTTSVLTWTTMADDWDRLRPTLIKVFALFQPPPTA